VTGRQGEALGFVLLLRLPIYGGRHFLSESPNHEFVCVDSISCGVKR
jgi:hypothetical protein